MYAKGAMSTASKGQPMAKQIRHSQMLLAIASPGNKK